MIRPVDKAKNDEPKNFAFVTFQNEEISKRLVSCFLLCLLMSGIQQHIKSYHQVKLGEDVMCKTKIVIKPVTFSIYSAAQSMIRS